MVCPPPDEGGYHLPTIDELDDAVQLVGAGHEVYLRYSEGPEADRDSPSMDYESGLALPGLSVTVLDPPDWWTRPAADWVARRVCKYVKLMEGANRRPWILVGRVAGEGPDHEPLIVEARPVAWLGPQAVEQARRRYHERFDVGRDSRG